MSIELSEQPSSVSLWHRRNLAEVEVRKAIDGQPGLSIFGIGLDENRGQSGAFFVTLTAANDHIRDAASRLLEGSPGSWGADVASGWRRLELGDWMIRVYPEQIDR